MTEFRKWTLHFDDGNNTIDGRRVQDPPGFTAAGGKELVSVHCTANQHHAKLEFENVKKQQQPDLLVLGQVVAGSSKSLNMDVALLKQRRQEVGTLCHLHAMQAPAVVQLRACDVTLTPGKTANILF